MTSEFSEMPADQTKTSSRVKKPRPAKGRPPRLSRAEIIDTSLELLQEAPLENFTLAKVAKRLDTVSMALYNYFESRDALLCAVADHICMDFKMPRSRANQAWQKKLRSWLNAVKDLSEQHPVILKISGVDGQTTAGWLRVTRTVSQTLYDQGMRGKELAINSYLFISQSMALIMFESMGSEFHSAPSLSHIDKLEPEEQDFYLELRPHFTKLTSDEILETAFDQMIKALELKLEENKK